MLTPSRSSRRCYPTALEANGQERPFNDVVKHQTSCQAGRDRKCGAAQIFKRLMEVEEPIRYRPDRANGEYVEQIDRIGRVADIFQQADLADLAACLMIECKQHNAQRCR